MSVRDTKLKEFIDGYHRALDDEMAALRVQNEASEVPLILTETEGFLRLLLELTGPSRILELGTAHGYSALFFARTCPGASVTTIERSPVMIRAAEETFSSHPEGSRIDLRTGDALEILRGLEEEISSGSDADQGLFDFVFIDAGKSHYREYFEICERICADEAIVVCDNILIKGWVVEATGQPAKRHRTNIKYMREFLDYINAREDLSVTLLSGGDGLAVIRFRNDK